MRYHKLKASDQAGMYLMESTMVISHNHPSGDPRPSQADIDLTKVLRDALALVDVKVFDHIIVGAKGVKSLAERGDM